jgi:hypothetical protein
MAVTEERVSHLEELVREIAYEHLHSEIAAKNTSLEIEKFKKAVDSDIADMRAQRAEMNRKWGELANKMGTIVEDIVLPNIPTIAATYFEQKTLNFQAARVIKEHPLFPGRVREFDIIAVGGDYLFLNETKSTPRQEYLEAFAENCQEVFAFFPEYNHKTLVPIFSSLNLSHQAVAYLTKNGIYAMAMKGDTMDLLNFREVAETDQ